MAAVTITPANFQVGSNLVGKNYQAGEAITAITPVYQSSSDGKVYIATHNDTEAKADVVGIAITKSAADGDYVLVISTDDLEFTVGGTVVAGKTYYLGAAGAIIPETDLASTNWSTRLFYATTTAKAKLAIKAHGVQLA